MKNFYQLFTESASRYPENIAVEIQREGRAGSSALGEQFTYRELQRLAESIGAWLEQQRLEPGARCALLAANHPRWVAAYLGVLGSGRIAVPLDTAFNPTQIRKLLLDSGATLVFTDQRNLEDTRTAITDLNVRLVLLEGSAPGAATFDEITAGGPAAFKPADVGPEDTAVLLYTSGTTADPKGVVLTHDNLLAESESVFQFVSLGPKDAILGVLPLFHALAQMANLLLPLAAGTRVVYLETLNTTELLRALRERDCTLFCCVPQFFYLIHERIMKQVAERGPVAQMAFNVMKKVSAAGRLFGLNLGKIFFRPAHEALGKRMRYLVTGGSRFDPVVGRDLQDMGFNVLQAYGLTETSGGAVTTPTNDIVIGSVGKPLAGVEVKLVPYKSEDDAETNGEGEIAIRGRIVMEGYYNRPDATEQVLRDGWLYTGDLGRFDERGNLFITGRKKDVIVLSSGKNIYPEEIEAHYLQSPWIREICVMGQQSKPGEPFSERLHAVIVPDFDVLKEKKIVNVNEVIRFDVETLSSQVPSTKRILSYDIWQTELPRTTTRKLKRFEIQRRVAAGGAAAAATPAAAERELSSEDAEWMQQPDVARALGIIRSAAKKNKDGLRPHHNLELDLGLDSMERVELLVALEHELGADVDEETVSQIYTVRELVEAIRAAMGAAGKKEGFRGWDAILAEDPSESAILDAIQPKPFLTRAWFLFGRLVNLFARDLFSMEVTGLEKLPRTGPFIISPNHQSFIDAPVLVATFPWEIYRKLFFVGTSEIFGAGPAKYLARSIKLVAVDPDANLIPAMRAGAFGLKRGNILVLFPEGERSIDGTPRTFKKGAAILSTHLRVPIVPVAVDGFYEAWPRGASFFQKFSRLKIAIGDPIAPREPGANPEQTYAAVTAELKARVMEMWTELHTGRPPEDSRAAAAD